MASHSVEQDEGGDGYFASVSDLMVGILFVFLLMLAVFALAYSDPVTENDAAALRQRTELEVERDALRLELTAQRRALSDARARIALLETQLAVANAEVVSLRAQLERWMALVNPREREIFRNLLSDLLLIERELTNLSDEGRLQRLRREILERLRERLQSNDRPGLPRIDVQISPQYDVLRLPSENSFPLNSSTFTERGRLQALRLLEELVDVLPCFARGGTQSESCPEPVALFETILIEGHTDTVRGENWRLSTDRALAVLNLMVGPLARIQELRNTADQPLIGFAGYGPSRTLPGIPGDDQRNRRIELRFLLATPSAENLTALRARVADIRARLDALQGRR